MGCDPLGIRVAERLRVGGGHVTFGLTRYLQMERHPPDSGCLDAPLRFAPLGQTFGATPARRSPHRLISVSEAHRLTGNRGINEVARFRSGVALLLLAAVAACSTPSPSHLTLPDGQPAGALSGRIIFEGRVPPAAFTDRYRVVVDQRGKLVRSEGFGAHDTYGWLLPAGSYSIELFGKLLAPNPLVRQTMIRNDRRTDRRLRGRLALRTARYGPVRSRRWRGRGRADSGLCVARIFICFRRVAPDSGGQAKG